MADLQFPWEAFMQAQDNKNKNKQQLAQLIGQTLGNVGQSVGQGIQKHQQMGAQNQFNQALSASGQPAQGPMTQGGQAPQQPPVNIGQLSSLFSKGFPGQNNPFMQQQADKLDPQKQADLQRTQTQNSFDQKKMQMLGSGESVPFEQALQIADTAGNKQAAMPFISMAQAQGRDSLNKQELADMIKTVNAASSSKRGDMYAGTLGIKQDQLQQSLMKDARDTLNPTFQKGPGKDNAMRLDAISRAEPLVNQMLSQQGGGDPRQMVEVATALNRVIQGGGSQAQAQIEHLIPQTAKGKFASWQEWFTSNPAGTQQQAFIKRYADTIQREKTAIKQRVEFQAQSNAPTLRVLKKVDPKGYQAVIDSVVKQYGSPDQTNGQPAQNDPLGILQ